METNSPAFTNLSSYSNLRFSLFLTSAIAPVTLNVADAFTSPILIAMKSSLSISLERLSISRSSSIGNGSPISENCCVASINLQEVLLLNSSCIPRITLRNSTISIALTFSSFEISDAITLYGLSNSWKPTTCRWINTRSSVLTPLVCLSFF